MASLTDVVPENRTYWIKWELEDLQGNKFDPPQYTYYKAIATGSKRNNMFQVQYEDGLKQYYSIMGINTKTKNILTNEVYNNPEIIDKKKEPRVGTEFQAVVSKFGGPGGAKSIFAQNALNLVALTDKEVEEQHATDLANIPPEVKKDMDESKSKKGYGGGKSNIGVETLNYFKDFAEYDIGAGVLDALAILGGGKKKRRRRKRKSRKPKRKRRKLRKTKRRKRARHRIKKDERNTHPAVIDEDKVIVDNNFLDKVVADIKKNKKNATHKTKRRKRKTKKRR